MACRRQEIFLTLYNRGRDDSQAKRKQPKLRVCLYLLTQKVSASASALRDHEVRGGLAVLRHELGAAVAETAAEQRLMRCRPVSRLHAALPFASGAQVRWAATQPPRCAPDAPSRGSRGGTWDRESGTGVDALLLLTALRSRMLSKGRSLWTE